VRLRYTPHKPCECCKGNDHPPSSFSTVESTWSPLFLLPTTPTRLTSRLAPPAAHSLACKMRRFLATAAPPRRPISPATAARFLSSRSSGSTRPAAYPLAPSTAAQPHQHQHQLPHARTLATGLSQTSTPVPSSSVFAATDDLLRRHVGPQPASVDKMLHALGYESLDAFVDDCVPREIRLAEDAIADEGADGIRALSESELLRRAKEIGRKNQVAKNFIGLGYHQAVRPRPPPRTLPHLETSLLVPTASLSYTLRGPRS